MRSVLRLSLFEEFELWLEGLLVYCRNGGKRLGSQERAAEDNYRDRMKAVLDVTGDLLQRCPKVIEREQAKSKPALGPGLELAPELTRGDFKKQFADFFHLWEYLQRLRIVGICMARHPALSLPEVKAYGSLVANQIVHFSRSEAHRILTRKYSHFKYQHLIDRDLASSIELDGIREELSRIFLEFLKILSYLDYFQDFMRRSFKYHRLFLLLHYLQYCYRRLLDVLEHSHKYLGYSLPQLNQEVTSVRFALKMEVKKIFSSELKGVETQKKLGEIYSRIETAMGLLTHITQQSFVGLVTQLNPAFEEKTLFVDTRDQQAEAVKLVADLNRLYQMTMEASRERDEEVFEAVVQAMDEFQEGSMRLLYYKDWEPVEEFGKELHEAEGDRRAFTLHRLEVFLSTLIGEVSKREILNSVNRAVGS